MEIYQSRSKGTGTSKILGSSNIRIPRFSDFKTVEND